MNTQTQTKPQQRQQQNAPKQQQAVVPANQQESQQQLKIHEEIEQRTEQFAAALPAHIPVERFKRVLLTALASSPALQRADRRTLFSSMMKCAQDGLLPDGREAALVIFNMKIKEGKEEKWIDGVQYMPMIQGIRKKVRNSNEIATWDVKAVYKQDKFIYEEGLNQTLQHIPYLEGPAGPLVAVYSIARLKSGEVSIDVMPKWQVDKVRGVSKAKDNGPWVSHYDEMAKKTVARRHSKVLPMSTDLDDLIRRDDTLYDMEGASDREVKTGDGPRRPHPREFHDADTGEITVIEDTQSPAAISDTNAVQGDAKAPEANAASNQSKASGAEAQQAKAETEKAAETKSPRQLAWDVGYQHAKEGRKLRAMPPEIAENEEQKAAYTEGYDQFFTDQKADG